MNMISAERFLRRHPPLAAWPGAPGALIMAVALFFAGAPEPAGASETIRAYWVFFRDRGAAALDDAALLERARALPPETWARRARAGAAIPDARDLPLWAPYVAQIAAAGRLRHESRWLNAVSVDLTDQAVSSVRHLPCVAAVRPVALARAASIGPGHDEHGSPLGVVWQPERIPARERPALLERETLGYGPSAGQLLEINVPALHALGYTGNRVRLMMIDTGFRKDHESLAHIDRIDEWDFVFGDGQTQNEPVDDPGQHVHGTLTWSVAGGLAPGILIGPAYGASFALAKTEDIRSETEVEEDHYVAALERADSLGVAVTSASLNYLCFDSGFCYEFEDKDGDTAVITVAIDIAAARGILCVNSQGNYGCDLGSLGTPADADSMLAVGAVDSLNVITSFSACGPTYDGRIKPEVVARGWRTWGASANAPDAYGPASGTSLSTPLVAGAAALLLEAHPEWSPMDVRSALLATADRVEAPDNAYGWGRIDAGAALHHTPLLHPYPFSLILPADSAGVSAAQPAFAWRASADPRGREPLEYTLRIAEAGPPARTWEIPVGSDTTVVLPFPLAPETAYWWDVTAATATGFPRLSRETHTLYTLAAASAPDAPDGARAPGLLRVALHANPVRDRLSFRVGLTAAAPGPAMAPGPAAAPGPAMALGPAAAPGPAASGTLPLRWRLHDPLGRVIAGGTGHLTNGSAEVDVPFEAGRGGRPARGVYYLEVRAAQQVARETVIVWGN